MRSAFAPTRRRRLGRALFSLLSRVSRAGLTALSRATVLPHRGRLRVPGMQAQARVAFDDFGVPHVRAATDADALAALGLCHALDRFFQMDLMRRALRGQVAALVGERPLGDLGMPPFGARRTTTDADRLLRALDVVPSAQRLLDGADDEGRALLDAYVAGVNAGIEAQRRRRPLEYRLLDLDLEPWRPLDSVVLAKGMALGLSFKWRAAPVLAAVADLGLHLASPGGEGARRTQALLPQGPVEACLAQARWMVEGVGHALTFLPPGPAAVGSNGFVVGGALSASGKPLLANDPHLALSLPGVWYLASVVGARYAAVGASMPGAPGIVLGHTPTLAWGLTNGMLDDADVWNEELDGTGTRYRVDGRWRELGGETHEIRRRGRSPVLFRLRRTHRGPLLSDAFPGYTGPALSLRATWMERGRDLEAFLGLGRARCAAEVAGAVAGYGSPAQNLFYADQAGEGGWRLMGLVPRRAALGHPSLPRDGRTSASDWLGHVPAEELPAFALSPRDRIVSANHPQVDGDYPHYLSNLYEPDYRARRITELLSVARPLTLHDLSAVQRDAQDLGARAFRERILVPYGQAARRQRPSIAPLLDQLLGWNGRNDVEATGATLWHLTYHHLARRVLFPLLGEALGLRYMALMNLVDRPLLEAFSDPRGTLLPEAARATVLGEALEAAGRDLVERGHSEKTPWGRAHALTLEHPVGAVRLLRSTFNRGPFPLAGGPYSVCSGQYLHHDPCEVSVGASFRQVVDLGDVEGSGRMISCGGQSGHVGSRHYDDLTPLWLAGAHLPMRLATEPSTGDVLLLEPG